MGNIIKFIIKKKTRWKKHSNSLQKGKARIAPATVFTCPDFNKPFEVPTDSSDYKFGEVLS